MGEGALAEPAPDSAPPRWCAPAVTDETVRALVADVDRRGYAVLPNYLRPDELRELQAFVAAAVDGSGGEYVVFNGKGAVPGTLLESLADDPQFNSLVRRVYEQGAKRAAPDQSLYQVLRCLAGPSGMKECFIFHFDSYVITMLLPIIIPTQGRRGHLLLAPNIRGVRPVYALNLLDKVVVDNKLTQRLLRKAYEMGLFRMTKVEMTPGDLYIFYGYRTLHTNEPCDLGNIRSTALFHFGDPHADSPLRRRMGRAVV